MNTKGWSVVKEDERYVVSDNDTLNKLITSITKLNAGYSTTGHSHKGQKKFIFFALGQVKCKLMRKDLKYKKGI